MKLQNVSYQEVVEDKELTLWRSWVYAAHADVSDNGGFLETQENWVADEEPIFLH